MVKRLLTALFLLSTPLTADPEPRVGLLPDGVHTYIWEVKRGEPDRCFFDAIELRLVIPVGPVHEKGCERGACEALYRLVQKEGTRFSQEEVETFLKQIRHHSWSTSGGEHLDATIFELKIPYEKRDLLPTALELLADWAWGWNPTHLPSNGVEIGPLEEREAALAAYFGLQTPTGRQAPPPLDVLIEFYNATYRSLPIAVVAAGDFDGDWVEQQIARAFSHPPSGDLGPLPEAVPQGIWPSHVSSSVATQPFLQDPAFVEAELVLPTDMGLPIEPRQMVRSAVLSEYLGKRISERLGWPTGAKEDFGGDLAMPTRSCMFHAFCCECRIEQLLPLLDVLEEELAKVSKGEICEEMLGRVLDKCGSEFEAEEFDADDYADLSVHHFCGTLFLPTQKNVAAVKRAVATLDAEELQQYAVALHPLSEAWVRAHITCRPEGVEQAKALITELTTRFHQ